MAKMSLEQTSRFARLLTDATRPSSSTSRSSELSMAEHEKIISQLAALNKRKSKLIHQALPPVPQHSYSKQGKWAKVHFPKFTKSDHAKRAKLLGEAVHKMEQKAAQIRKSEEARLGARSWLDTEKLGTLISGGIHANYSEKAKDQIRAINRKARQLSDQAFAHYSASGIRENTAVDRWRRDRSEEGNHITSKGLGGKVAKLSQRSLDRS